MTRPVITAAGAFAGITAEAYHGTELCPEHSISATGLVLIHQTERVNTHG